jgi:hypothetical protein
VKNGWLPPATGGRRIHTLGVGLGRRDCVMAVLSDENPSMDYGVTTVGRVASAINRNAFWTRRTPELSRWSAAGLEA